MIAYLNGILTEKNPTHVLLEVGGIGYEVFIPLSTYEQLPEIGAECRLLTVMHVREDAHLLYGFYKAQEKELFLLLISVSGIGPKSAISLLSGTPIEEFKRAILQEDLALLSSFPGIGKKTAQRLVVELKDKISRLSGAVSSEVPVKTGRGGLSAEEAVMALVSLGYSRAASEKAVQQAMREVPEEALSLQNLIKRSLRLLTTS